MDHALENATSSAQSNGSTGKKSSNHKSEVANDDAGHGKYPPKLIEQLDATTKKVVRRYDGAKAAAAAMDLPYDKVYLRCYNQKRRNVSTPLGMIDIIATAIVVNKSFYYLKGTSIGAGRKMTVLLSAKQTTDRSKNC